MNVFQIVKSRCERRQLRTLDLFLAEKHDAGRVRNVMNKFKVIPQRPHNQMIGRMNRMVIGEVLLNDVGTIFDQLRQE